MEAYDIRRYLPVLVISPLPSPAPVPSTAPTLSVMVDTPSPYCSVSVDEAIGPIVPDSDKVIDIDPSPCSNVAHTSGSEPKEVASEVIPLEFKHVVQPDREGREEILEQKQVARVVGSRLCCCFVGKGTKDGRKDPC